MSEKSYVLKANELSSLFKILQKEDYTVMGPTIRDQAIVYDELQEVSELPIGWTDEQEAGSYRIKKRKDQAYFGYAVGPHSWKKVFHPPIHTLWTAQQENGKIQIKAKEPDKKKYALLGVRSCELHAIAIQDRVFMKDTYQDPTYENRRQRSFIVAVNCSQASSTCFCTSMDAGPKAKAGFDLALTEVLDKDNHYFVLEVGSENGKQIVSQLPCRLAQDTELKTAQEVVEKTKTQMGRSLDTDHLKELLYENYEHPRWEEVANRCLSCTNCTMVCPTCFCTTVEDVTDLSGKEAKRVQRWDSCFTMEFSHIHGGSVRSSTKSRYRQWMTHKLATWWDQFGTTGCVGCGRCITWCPVGIDITEEAGVIRSQPVPNNTLNSA